MKTKIKIKKYVENNNLSWEEKYRELEKHHLDETKYLIKIIEKLEDQINFLNKFNTRPE